MKKYLWTVNRIILTLALGLILLGFGASPAVAQSQTVLFVSPDQMEIPLGNDVGLEIEILLGVNINAFDLTVVYDPEVLSLEEWEHGDFLDNLANVKVEEEPGFLRVAATQLATPAVSGDGTLLEIIFNTLAAGQSAIELVDVTFADSEGTKTEPELEEGLVDVVLSATYTPTPTPTSTPTPKPTVTPQPTDDGSGYPVKYDPTQTATTAVGDNPLIAPDEGVVGFDQQTATAESYPAEDGTIVQEPDGDQGGYPETGASEDANPPAGQNDESAADGNADSNQALSPGQTVLNVLLWAVLILAVLVLIGMMIIAARRQKQKPEDYLL